jgi:hypothetical protein
MRHLLVWVSQHTVKEYIWHIVGFRYKTHLCSLSQNIIFQRTTRNWHVNRHGFQRYIHHSHDYFGLVWRKSFHTSEVQLWRSYFYVPSTCMCLTVLSRYAARKMKFQNRIQNGHEDKAFPYCTWLYIWHLWPASRLAHCITLVLFPKIWGQLNIPSHIWGFKLKTSIQKQFFVPRVLEKYCIGLCSKILRTSGIDTRLWGWTTEESRFVSGQSKRFLFSPKCPDWLWGPLSLPSNR